MKHLVFALLGSVARECQWKQQGANIPMSKWLKGLLGALLETNQSVIAAGHLYEASFPKGRLFPPVSQLDEGLINYPIKFSNLPFIRNSELSFRYSRVARRFRKSGVPVLVTYNPQPWHISAAKSFQKLGGKWVNLVLDFDEKDLGKNWSGFDRLCGSADAHVFLSWWGFENCPYPNKLHLDSGVSNLHFEPKEILEGSETKKKIVLYAGKITEHAGASLMARAILQTKGNDLEFRICGRGQNKELDEAVRKDPRIKLIGYVGDKELYQQCLDADIFLNPREPLHSENRLIFPSKILEYLAYGKPVVSTWTDGLAPVYRDLLFVAEPSNPEGLSCQITKALEQSSEAALERRRKLYAFLTNERSWKHQAQRLIYFIEKLP